MRYSERHQERDFGIILGKTLVTIDAAEGAKEVHFTCADGTRYLMYHDRECCESVTLHDIAGNLGDLIGAPLVMAEETSNSDDPPPSPDSWTWTYYKLATVNGFVTLRWLGESNGWYSEGVEFKEVLGD